MKYDNKYPQLRQKAEELLNQKKDALPNEYYQDIERLVEELNIHQIELEMQYLELQNTNEQLTTEREKYRDLYLKAPIAYFTLNNTGNIVELNNEAANLLQLPIQYFNHTSIFRFLETNSKKEFTRYFKQIFDSDSIEYGDISFITQHNQIVHARLDAVAYFDTDLQQRLCRCAVTNLTERRNTLIALKEKEERFRNLFNNNNDGVRIVDENGIVIEENNRMEQITGVPAQNIIGKFIWDVIFEYTPIEKQTPENYAKTKEIIQNALKPGVFPSGNQPVEKEMLCADGKVKNVEATHFALPSKNGHLLYSIVRDVTDIKKAHQELILAKEKAEDNEQKYRLIAENTSDGIIVIGADTKIQYASPAYLKQLGYSEKEELSHGSNTIYKLIHPEDRDVVFASIFKAIKEKKDTLIYSYRVKHINGHYIWREDHAKFNYDSNGNHLNTHVICRDITERKNAEQELIVAKKKAEENEKRYKSIFESSPIAIWEIDFSNVSDWFNELRAEGITEISSYFDDNNDKLIELSNLSKIIEINDTSLELLKAVSKAQIKQNSFSFLTNDSIEIFKQLLCALFNGETKFNCEIPLLDIHGVRMYFDLSLAVQKGHEKSFASVLVSFIDITEKKRNHEALIKSEERYISFISQSTEGIYRMEMQQPLDINLPVEEQIDYIYDNAYIAECNNKFVEMYEAKSIESLIGKRPADFQGGKDNPINREETKQFIESAYRITDKETIETTQEGIIKYFSNNSVGIIENHKLIRIWGTQTDITNRKKIENEKNAAKQLAEESERKYRLLAENSSDIVWILDLTLEFKYLSPSTERLLGYSLEERKQLLLEKVCSIETIAQYKALINSRMQEYYKTRKNDPQIFELTGIHKDGHEIHFEVSAKFIIDENGNIDGIQGTSRDISERKKSELIIRKLQKAVESTKACILITDIDGHIEYANPFFTESTGYTPDEYTGKNSKFLKTDLHDQAYYKNLWDTIKSGQTWEGKFCNRKKNGELYWENAIISPITNNRNEITHFVAIKTDITEAKKINEELIIAKEKAEESEYKVRSMFENTHIGIIFCNTQGEILEANPSILDILGSPSLEASKKINLLTFKPLVEIGFAQNVAKCIDEKLIITEEVIYASKWGKIVFMKYYLVPVVVNNKVIGVWVNLNNLTDLWRTQQELITAKEKAEESEKKLKQAHEIAKLGSWELNVETGIFTFTDSFYKVFHTTAKQMGGYQMSIEKYVNQFVHPEDALMVASENQKAIETKDTNFTGFVELRILYCDGGIGYISVKYFIVKDRFGITIKTYGVNQDITERKIIEQELIAAKEKAEESDKLKTAFLNNISHEFRTPMNAIIGFSELMSKTNQKIDKQKQFSEIIADNCNKLLEIVTDVIEVSQLQSNQMTVRNSQFNFIELVRETLSINEQQIKDKGLDFIFNVNPNVTSFTIISDMGKLSKILKHMVDNAKKFTHHGAIIIDFLLSNNKIEFTVADTGIGISKEMQQIIFEPFRQLETGLSRNYGGNGVGLAIIKGYVHLLNGNISMQSEPNIGTTLHVKIPIQTLTEDNIKQKDAQYSNNNLGTVLIVEDEQSNYLYLLELLHEVSTNILYASNGEQAIDICRNQKQINIVLMDIKMPIMDGYTATKLIKEFRAELPIIAITAYALDEDKEQFLNAGFDDYLCKPINLDELFTAIHKIL